MRIMILVLATVFPMVKGDLCFDVSWLAGSSDSGLPVCSGSCFSRGYTCKPKPSTESKGCRCVLTSFYNHYSDGDVARGYQAGSSNTRNINGHCGVSKETIAAAAFGHRSTEQGVGSASITQLDADSFFRQHGDSSEGKALLDAYRNVEGFMESNDGLCADSSGNPITSGRADITSLLRFPSGESINTDGERACVWACEDAGVNMNLDGCEWDWRAQKCYIFDFNGVRKIDPYRNAGDTAHSVCFSNYGACHMLQHSPVDKELRRLQSKPSFVLTRNLYTCPGGYSVISSASECQTAVNSVTTGLTVEEHTDAGDPIGCWVYGSQHSPSHAYFNTGGRSSYFRDQRNIVCKFAGAESSVADEDLEAVIHSKALAVNRALMKAVKELSEMS